MSANMIRNLCQALKGLPVVSITFWMDSTSALYWIASPGKQWKTFVSNKVSNIAKITEKHQINWKYCPSDINITDLGARGAFLDKMETGNWYEGPKWLLNESDWPDQPVLKTASQVNEEAKKITDVIAYTSERKPDEWGNLLDRKSYWKTLRITSWILRFMNNCKAKAKNEKGTCTVGPLQTEEIRRARNDWIVRVQIDIPEHLENPGFKLERDPETGILKCAGRVQGYKLIYLLNGVFVQKLAQCVHQKIGHLSVASTMATLKEKWYMIQMRAQVKKQIRQCNICNAFSTKPFKLNIAAPLPKFRTEVSRPFQYSGVDFCGP